ncbi:Cytochrome C oxidase, cbb3-type, subunit III [Faunimonas pinastri]|uniref:Cytochrome C oxidase, cbb3-type, subunit III n=1 Tax=Faunimonas pinastri TaxID=1855383 RepID=A0A1H9LV22_9HYPH|nr:cytochrome c [Faunimonas pinastri]SER14703.1 Cytochrome C oxidase, cbb3-type, subunit III [Faunimonas pinastri]
MKRAAITIGMVFATLALAGCKQDMDEQPKLLPLSGAAAFDKGQAARPLPEGTVARNEAVDPAEAMAAPTVDAALVQRGRERYEIFCSPCHGFSGYGDGMIVKRGFPAPPSFHSERLRQTPASHVVDVIANGYGVMYSYGDRVAPRDRWAIAAYVRALQLSQAGEPQPEAMP